MIDSRPVCDYEGSNYQSEFWDKGERQYEDLAERIALKAFLPTSGRAALELGAGAGRLTPMLAGFQNVVLLDYSRTQMQQARARLGDSPRYTYLAANVYQLPFAPGTFDGATMIRVIHHLADAPAALKEIQTALAPGGTFILEFANKRNWKAIFRYGLRRQTWSPFSPEPVEFVKLNFDFHPRTLQQWLADAGFTVEHKRTVSHYRIGLLKRIFPANFLAALDAMVQPTGDYVQFTPSVFVKCKVNGQAPTTTQPFNIRDSFRCPVCKTLLTSTHTSATDEVLSCTNNHRWGYKDGIYDFKEQFS
jgi:ubiquinone/menaquinone biosynthesis C-methylase UbiE